MTETTKPVWLLDIDGVINAVANKPDGSVWPKETWHRKDVAYFPMLVAEPVLEFIRDVHRLGLAEIRWHTTWQQQAITQFAPAFDLPDFQLQEGYKEVNGVWPKIYAYKDLRLEDRPCIWTDDDLDNLSYNDDPDNWVRSALPRSGSQNFLRRGNSLLIAPRPTLGLTRRHLKEIADFIGRPDLLK